LDTRFFATPVAKVVARQRRKDVELVISLKEDALPEPRNEVGPDGTHFLVLQFPLGKPDVPARAPTASTGDAPEPAAADRPVLAGPASSR
jgi:hypothetical protein